MSLIKPVTIDNYVVKKMCRICLEQKTTLFSLFTNIEFQEENLVPTSISDIIFTITTKLVTNDKLPTQICQECKNLVKSAYIFKLKFEESSCMLQDFILTDSKSDLQNVSLGALEHDCISDNDSEPGDCLVETKSFSPIPKEDNSKGKTRHSITKENVEESNCEYSGKTLFLCPCPICTVELPALELRKHAHTHKALNKYLGIPKVNENTKFFARPQQKISLFNQTEILHKCPFCNLDFSVQQFRIHVENHRNQDEFKCDKCERVFKKLNHLNTHRVKHLKEYPYKCDQCGKGFVIKKNYDCHMLTHTNNELPHECSYCFKRFSNPEHLNRHQIIHTENVSYSVKYKVCKCRHCLKTFRDRGDLKKHNCIPIAQTISASKFCCKTCKKGFKHSSGLYNHIRNIHKRNGSKTLCSVCGCYVSNIYNHMIRHTGEKPFQCNQCDKRFVAKPQLRQHLLVHSGLKPYVCSVCAKAFNSLYNLQVHERIHKGDRCHICHVCGKGFLEKSYLKKHMNIHKKMN